MISLPPLKFHADDFEVNTTAKRPSGKYTKHPLDCMLVTDSMAARSSSDTLHQSEHDPYFTNCDSSVESVESFVRSRNAFDYYASSNHSPPTSPGSFRLTENLSALPRGSISNRQSMQTLQLVSSFLQCLDDDINMCTDEMATEYATTGALKEDFYAREDWEEKNEHQVCAQMCVSCPEAATIERKLPRDSTGLIRSTSALHLQCGPFSPSQGSTRSSSQNPSYSKLFGSPERRRPAIASCPVSPFPVRVSRRVDTRPATRRRREAFFKSTADDTSGSAATTSESATSLPRLTKLGRVSGLAGVATTGPGITGLGIPTGRGRRQRRGCLTCSLDGLRYHPSCPVMNSCADTNENENGREDEEVMVLQDL
jgi:hypothetical protein